MLNTIVSNINYNVSPDNDLPGLPDTKTDSVATELDSLTAGKHVLVFSGFSGLGYKDPAALNLKLAQILETAEERHGLNSLLVVAGATTEGIGAVYAIAQKMGIATLGIVSEMAFHQGVDISPDCRNVVYVPDPTGSWKVLDDAGASYMTYVAKENGTFHALGGGNVTLSELREAQTLGIPSYVLPEFEPDAQKSAARLKENPSVDLTPVKTEVGWQELDGDSNNLYHSNVAWRPKRADQVASANALWSDMAIGERDGKVKFADRIAVSDTFIGERRLENEYKLHRTNEMYRREMDGQAKVKGYSYAVGYEDWEPGSSMIFDEQVAINTLEAWEREDQPLDKKTA